MKATPLLACERSCSSDLTRTRTRTGANQSSALARIVRKSRERGVAIVETAIALPILLVVILGAIQFGLIYEAKATLNHAALQAARSGAVSHADAAAIRRGLARGLLPLYSPDSSMAGIASTIARIEGELSTGARIRILNPTREAFDDFGEDIDGLREIPNDRLHTLSTTLGTRSGINIQDANILRVEITYGYELKVPLVNWFITRTLLATRSSDAGDAFEQQLLRRTLLPIVATSTVRMQSPARLNDLVVSRADLPDVQRIDPASSPPDEQDEERDEPSDGDSDSNDDENGSSLADGFFGFGGGPADGSGGGGASGNDGGAGSGSGNSGGGGENSGNPQMCSVGDGNGAPPWPPSNPSGGSPSPTQSGLGASQPISLPNLSVGNPIHVVTGNKYQLEIDLPALSDAGSLAFARHYNSDSISKRGILGAGWRHSFEASLSYERQTDSIVIRQADGRAVRFERSTGTHDTVGSASMSAASSIRYDANRASDGYAELHVNGGATWHAAPRRILDFDAEGRLVTLRDGRAQTRLLYSADGRLDRIQDSHERSLHLAYYRNGRLARVRAPSGTWRYRYDENGNLSSVASPARALRRYHYEDPRHPHHLTGITVQALNLASYGERPRIVRIATWAYDADGRGILSTHPEDAGKVTLSYDTNHTDVTDAFGRTSRYLTEIRDGIALVTEVRGPGCRRCGEGNARYVYNERVQVTDMFARDGFHQHYEYDSQGRLIEISRSTNGGAREWLARYAYDDSGQLARIERPSINPDNLHTIELLYTDRNDLETVTERGYAPTADGSFIEIERTSRVQYDDAGRIAAIDGPREGASDITRFVYDAQQLAATIGPNGVEQRVVAHDSSGRPQRIRITGSPDIELQYDSVGRVAALIQHRRAGDLTTRYEYDAAGRLRQVEHPDGSIRRIGHDAAGRVSRHTSSRSGLTQALAFGPDGQVSRTALITRTGEVLRMLHFAYDTQRRLLEIRDGEGPPLRQLIYDDNDSRPDRTIDPLGHETLYRYDAYGYLASTTASDGGLVDYDYDKQGRLTGITAPNDAHTRYEYDDFGRPVREHSSDRGVTRYVYDGADNVIEKIDARSVVTRFTYTPGNQLETVVTDEGRTRFSYANGRVVGIEGPWGLESFLYSVDGDLEQHRRSAGGRHFSTEYRYDSLRRITRRKLPSGEWLQYEYDGGAAPMRIVRNQLFRDRTLLGELNGGGRPLAPLGDIRFGNELTQQTRFDASGRVGSRSIEGVARRLYKYDDASRLIQVDTEGAVEAYDYDATGRLIAARSPEGDYQYEYDRNGNRQRVTRSLLAKAESAHATQYEYAPQSNRLISTGESGGTLSYDAAGNPLEMGDRRYEYNSAGRPIKFYVDDRLAAEYEYNIWGERIRKTRHSLQGRQTTFYLYERHRLIAEADERGRITREYLYLDHHPVAMLDRGVPYWIHTDHLGSPLAVTDAKRRIVWRTDYAPFGLANVQEDPDRDGRKLTLNLRFPGQYADAESGTHYNIMRDYDPALGRYMTPDPLGAFDGMNPFAYVHGNPTNSFDSLGLYDEMVHYYMTYFLALVAGLPQDAARTMAIATQYVDENWLTQPVRLGSIANAAALPLYHFVLDDQGPLYGDGNMDPLTRFYNPSSDQLANLLASTDRSRLRDLWVQAHPSGTPGLCPLPDFAEIDNARYQLFGEYLHAYEDTFSHRDLLNVPYGVDPSVDTHPVATYGGHTGLYDSNPFEFEQPDRTYNQDEDDEPSRCELRYVLGGSETRENVSSDACAALGRQSNVATATYVPRPSKCVYTYFRHAEDLLGTHEEVRGITAEECSERATSVQAIQTHFLPEGDLWAYNELRTLRMEYEIFQMLGEEFAEEIVRNRERYEAEGVSLPSITWEHLAGRLWDEQTPGVNSRLGVEHTYDEWRRERDLVELNTVLQRYNASSGEPEDRLAILNVWLEQNNFRDVHGESIRIEPWDLSSALGASNRWDNIGWIPSNSFDGVLLPRDEPCQTLPWETECDERPRR